MPRTKASTPAGVPEYDRNVFINCPFDSQYQPLFRALIFAVEVCGYRVRCALEVEDSGEIRANKIVRIIKSCALGVHDISRTELTPEGLPHFNMPYELGLFIGCAIFGRGPDKTKRALILDREKYRYNQYLSDIAGQDIQEHGNDPAKLVKKVRNWLANHTFGRVPGGDAILEHYHRFCADLPEICADLHLTPADLENYRDFHNCVIDWLIANRLAVG